MVKNFPVEIKDGYVLEITNKNRMNAGETVFVGVFHNYNDELCVSGEDDWFPLECFNENLCYHGIEVIKVYGRSWSNRTAYDVTNSKFVTDFRDVLWEREEKKSSDPVSEFSKEAKEAVDFAAKCCEMTDKLIKEFGGKISKAEAVGIVTVATMDECISKQISPAQIDFDALFTQVVEELKEIDEINGMED